jgi:arginyl-tRNA synthetase
MLKDTLAIVVAQALTSAQQAGALPAFDQPEIQILRPKQADHGDYSCNVAMIAAAAIRQATGEKANPRQIAQAIVDHMALGDLIERVELAGPGFINIWLSTGWLQSQVATILAQDGDYGNLTRGEGQHWQVEFVSANPTGPIHYGGARNAVLGDALANVLEAAGYEVQREFYVNDGGTQFRLFVETLYARYMQALGHDAEIPEDGYRGAYMAGYAQRIVDEYGDQFAQLDKAEALAAIRPVGRAIVMSALETELGDMGVSFDNWFSEQSLYDSGLVEQSLSYLDERGELARRDGAVWFQASKYPKNEKDEVVIRSNGQPTYFAADIAYHYDKFIRRGFDKVVNVWAVDHQGHVSRMNAMMQAFGLDPERLIILMYDLVKLVRDGREERMSKRAGTLLTIGDVVAEVGPDALRFNLLMRSPESTIEFDLDLAVKEENDNPVHYVRYGHARMCSIIRRAREKGFEIHATVKPEDAGLLALLSAPAELALIRKVIELEEQIEIAIDKLSPHNLPYYALDLTKVFSGFYRDCLVVDVNNPDQSRARLYLTEATRIVLAKTLALMGVSAPVRMKARDEEDL